MDAGKAAIEKKFPEPHGWALKWTDFSPMPPREVARPATEPAPKHSNGASRKFPEPQGWALQWDGFCLLGDQERRTPSPSAGPR
jgi:hypothetical protein